MRYLLVLLLLWQADDGKVVDSKPLGLKIELPKKMKDTWMKIRGGKAEDTQYGGKSCEWSLSHAKERGILVEIRALTKPDNEKNQAYDLDQAADTENMNIRKKFGKVKEKSKKKIAFGKSKERCMHIVYEAMGDREVWVYLFEAKKNKNYYRVRVAGIPKLLAKWNRDIQILFLCFQFAKNEEEKKDKKK